MSHALGRSRALCSGGAQLTRLSHSHRRKSCIAWRRPPVARRYETQNHLWVILEYCVGGDLLALLRSDGRLPEPSGEPPSRARRAAQPGSGGLTCWLATAVGMVPVISVARAVAARHLPVLLPMRVTLERSYSSKAAGLTGLQGGWASAGS